MPRNPRQNGTGPSRTPRKVVRKKLQYTEQVTLNNATSDYSYLSRYVRPDVTKATGAMVQFAAYELWRIKKIKVYIQMANATTTVTGDFNSAMDFATSSVIWTAADLGANESVSGASIMQYSNAKKNTCSLNKWTPIVDTGCRLNMTPNTTSGFSWILPPNTWLNTINFDSSQYSGYQIFIQNFGVQQLTQSEQPSFSIITELDCEFLQPAYQNNASNFSSRAFAMKMVTQPNAADPTELRTYVFNRITVSLNPITNERQMIIRLTREDGIAGSLTYNSAQLRQAIADGNSGIYFDARPIIYDGPFPPENIPDIDYDLTT